MEVEFSELIGKIITKVVCTDNELVPIIKTALVQFDSLHIR